MFGLLALGLIQFTNVYAIYAFQQKMTSTTKQLLEGNE